MRYLKITIPNGETRWLNLDHVARATRTFDSDNGEPIMVLMFCDADRLTLHGTTPEQVEAIEAITDALDECVSRGPVAA